MQKYYIVLHGKQEENKEKNEIVIDTLKKYNRKMLILKIIVAVLSIFIVFIGGKFIVEHIQKGIEQQENYEKGNYIYDIINEAYCNMDEILNSNNYSIIEESTTISYDFKCVYSYLKTEEYYKDGYYKEAVSTANLNRIENNYFVNYGLKIKGADFHIQVNGNGNIAGGISATRGNFTIGKNELEVYYKENVLEYKDYQIREEKVEEKNYYVISQKANKDDGIYCTEIWINKEDMQLFKITDEKVGSKKTERVFTLSINNVKEEDVKVNYQGEDENLQELGKFFEKIKKCEFEEASTEVMKWNIYNSERKITFDTYVNHNMKIITANEGMDIILKKAKIEGGEVYSYEGIVFDQKGDAYYAYNIHKTIDNKYVFIENIFVSIFGNIVKTSAVDMELNNGELVVLQD